MDEQEKASLASMPSIPSPRVSLEQPCFDQQILSLVEAVLHGKQQWIDHTVNSSQTFFDQKTLTQRLKTELITFAKQGLLNIDSAFSKKAYQTIVDQLSAKTNQLLNSPEMLRIPITPAKFPQPDYFKRQNSQQSLSDASTASSETFKSSLRHQLSYSQVDKQATVILNQFQKIHCAKVKRYPDFYRGYFFNSQKSIINTHSIY